MNDIHFEPNVPQVLSLKDTAGCLDGFNVLYECVDGRVLSLPRPAAVKLNTLDPAPGEEVSIAKYRKEREPAEWVVALTPRSEQVRAEREAAELAQATQRDTAEQLRKSLQTIRQMPKNSRTACAESTNEGQGTGTYGPVPQTAPAGRKPRGETIPFNIAVGEVVKFVTSGLRDAGEQWSDASKQDLVSTVIIAAAKMGLLGVWER